MYEQIFPFLQGTNWRITSPIDPNYNCIAWAAEDNKKFWWPDEDGYAYWPEGVPRDETLDSFIQAYSSIGFKICKDYLIEEGFTKIAIYVDKNGKPTHAARQLDSGKWTSKLGQEHDIEHELFSLNNSPSTYPLYGEIKTFMKKSKNTQQSFT